MTEFEGIYQRYFRDVYLYIRGLSRDEHVAEEVTQETFFRAMDALSEFRGDCDIRVWLCQIAKREYFGWLRKNKRLTSWDTAQNDEMPLPMSPIRDVTVDLEQRLVDQETAVRIHRLLHEMQEPYKEVFQLRVFGELSFDQIGDIFGKTANWACVTYHRAKSKIQKAMEES